MKKRLGVSSGGCTRKKICLPRLRTLSFFTLHTSHLTLLFLMACASHPGQEVYVRSGCPQCHGPERAGTAKGPPLEGLRHLWTPETLRSYLEKPAAYIEKDPRLQTLKEQYKTIMPQFAMKKKNDSSLSRICSLLLHKRAHAGNRRNGKRNHHGQQHFGETPAVHFAPQNGIAVVDRDQHRPDDTRHFDGAPHDGRTNCKRTPRMGMRVVRHATTPSDMASDFRDRLW